MTYVLLHGGGSTGRFWDRLIEHLDAPSLAIDLPGRADRPADLATLSVDEEVESVVTDIKAAEIEEPIVIVAHSSGGLVVPGVVAALGGRVDRIVVNAALVPPDGGSGLDCMQPQHAAGLRDGVERARKSGDVITLPGPPDDAERFRRSYGGDPLDDDQLAYIVDPVRCVPDTVHHYFQPVHWSEAADVDVTYIVNEHDRPIPTELQDEMWARLPRRPRVIRLDSGHIPAVTQPAEFARLLVT